MLSLFSKDNIFNLYLVKLMDVESTDTENNPYSLEFSVFNIGHIGRVFKYFKDLSSL